jgi:uncharacterized protein (DUF433 family)
VRAHCVPAPVDLLINSVINEGILPAEFLTSDDGRSVRAAACALISFYFESAGALTSEERLFVIGVTVPRLCRSTSFAMAALLKEDWTVRHEFLTIDLTPFVRGAVERLARPIVARNLVESSPEILGGMPVIRGTRVPVYDVAASVSAGIPVEDILDDYPSLDREKVELAAIFAEANPPRGRPRVASSFRRALLLFPIVAFPDGKDRREVSDRRVPQPQARQVGTRERGTGNPRMLCGENWRARRIGSSSPLSWTATGRL